jgi:hypothetical protein
MLFFIYLFQGSPDAQVNSDYFAVRWTGQVQPVYSDIYTFYVSVDDGARLWVNGQLLIDEWVSRGRGKVREDCFMRVLSLCN